MPLFADISRERSTKPPAFDALRRLAQPSATAREQCELCGLALPGEHTHLVEVAESRLLCACEACSILFDSAEGSRYRRVPRCAIRLPEDAIRDEEWNGLGIPIGLAFFFQSTAAGRLICLYPSVGGAIEAQLPMDAWDDLSRKSPWLPQLKPDTTALLVNRMKISRQHFLAPIDQCYRLIGIVRTQWRGFSGGTSVWQEIDRFFADLSEHASAFKQRT